MALKIERHTAMITIYLDDVEGIDSEFAIQNANSVKRQLAELMEKCEIGFRKCVVTGCSPTEGFERNHIPFPPSESRIEDKTEGGITTEEFRRRRRELLGY